MKLKLIKTKLAIGYNKICKSKQRTTLRYRHCC